MSSPVNPYESPTPETDRPAVARSEYMQVTKRSVIPVVIGAISFVWGGGGLLSQLVYPIMMAVMPADMIEAQQEAMAQSGYSMTILYSIMALGTITSLVLLVSAFGLVTYRRWGRTGFNIYGVLCILSAMISIFIVLTQEFPPMPAEMGPMAGQMETFQRVSGVVSNLLMLLFPGLGMFFVNRRTAVASLK